MPTETLIALFALAATAAWTPGPNNLMLAASGANFGLRRTVPHALGVAIGCFAMMFAVASGLGAIIAASPVAKEAMRWLGAGLLLWFAWRFANAGRASADARSRPLSFLEAAGFQWVNPKAWAMMLAMSAQFVSGENIWLESAICGFAFAATGIFSSFVWASFGVGIAQFLQSDRRLRVFNIVMALTLVAFVVLLVRGDI